MTNDQHDRTEPAPAFADDRLPYEELMRVVRSVRNRWRMKLLLRGLLVVLGVGFVAFALAVWVMNLFLYSEGAVTLFRWFTWISLLALVVRFLVVPLLQRAPNRRVALYIEEHEPSLQSAVLSAVELGGQHQPQVSPAMQRSLMESAIERCEQIDYAQGIERTPLRRLSGALAGVAGAGALAVLLSPAFLQHGALLLFAPWKAAADQNPYRIQVYPGDIEVPRGSDQRVLARLVGFEAEEATLAVRFDGDDQWQRWAMTAADAQDVLGPIEEGRTARDTELLLLDVRRDAEYMVEAGTIGSTVHRLTVVDVPYVDRIDLTYRFPDYAGLSPQVVEDGGDMVVLVGTQVELRIHPTVPVTSGSLRVEGLGDDQAEQELRPSPEGDGTWLADLTVSGSGYYRVELRDHRQQVHRASPEYRIEALADQGPILRVSKPGRDVRASKIEEVFLEVEAEDDYGLTQVELLYSVNGGDEQRVSLYRGRGQRELRAGHTLFLEELGLEDGDFVSYYAQARDGNRFGGAQSTTSDIYFVEIRPFGQEYRRAPEGGGGMGGGGGLDSSLSLQQRQIIAATFKLKRDKAQFDTRQLEENVKTVSLSQARLREQVQTLIFRMGNRAQIAEESEFQKILEELGLALPQMIAAESELEAKRLDTALSAEQRAMTHLQRAESVFRDVRVSFDASGGGRGGESQLAEDLADLFELELDKLRNQYEVVQRGREQETDREIDELEERLKELARRQQQENERRNRMRGQPTGGGGGGQQEMAEEAEEIARRLERLAREQSRPELRETAQRLREAANEMRRAQGPRGGQTGASGISALERLSEARRLLDKNRNQRFDQQLAELSERAGRVQEQQRRISSQVEQMGGGEEGAQGQAGEPGRAGEQRQSQRPGAGRDGRGGDVAGAEEIERLLERKDRLHQEVGELEDELDRLARAARAESPEVARGLQEAANSVRKNQLKEKIRYSKAVVENRDQRYAKLFEDDIARNVDDLVQRIGEAQASLGQSPGERKEGALAQARELVEGLESLERRLRERQEEGEPGQGGGEPGEGEGEATAGEQIAQQSSGQPGEGQQGRGERGSEESKSGERGREGSESGERGRERESGSQAGEQSGDGDGHVGEGHGGEGSRTGQRLRDRGRQGPDAEGEGEGGNAPSAGLGSALGSTARIGPSDGAGFQPGRFSTEELRQLSKELLQRAAEARKLRDTLREQGVNVADLDAVLRQMDQFNIRGLNNDPLALAKLREQVVEGLRQFEFRIWRELEGAKAPVRLSGQDRVPAGFEERVDEYFRSLARSGGSP
jgi:hypothetical protein